MRIEIAVRTTEARGIKYYLGKRFGSRKSLETLVKQAVRQIVAEEAQKELEEAEKKL